MSTEEDDASGNDDWIPEDVKGKSIGTSRYVQSFLTINLCEALGEKSRLLDLAFLEERISTFPKRKRRTNEYHDAHSHHHLGSEARHFS
jgi:hypothetical protein